ncbi:hypothetical protein [Kitasatospora sp. NPDC004531]
MAVDVRVRGRAAHSAVLRELLLLWEAARRSGGRTITQKQLARLGGIGPSTLNGWLSGRSLPREIDRLTIVARELSRAAGLPVRRARYWAALLEADRRGPGARTRSRSGHGQAPNVPPTPAGEGERSAGRRRASGAGPVGPRLVHRYYAAPAEARALVDAALDAVRLGHRPALPVALVTAAAQHYVAEHQRDVLGPVGAAEAWAYLRAEDPEAGGALASDGPGSDEAGRQTAEVRLAAALVRELRPERESRAVPAGLWECLTRHAHPADRPALARAAAVRGLDRVALGLCASAAEAGHHAALLDAAALLAEAGRTAEAADRCVTAADLGVAGAATRAAELLERDGQYRQAVAWYDRAAAAGDTDALCRCAELLGRTGETAAALERFEAAARAGHPGAHYRAGLLLAGLGRRDEALDRFARAAADGHPAAPAACARIWASAGRTDQAVAWWERAWEQGVTTVHEAAEMWEAAGRIDEAAACYERAAAACDETAFHEAAALYARHGQYGDLPWFAHIGDHQALRELAEQCERDGDLAGALDWYAKAVEAGNEAALFQAADMLERNGDRVRAVHWYELAAGRGDTCAMRELGRLLAELGRSQESVSWYRAAIRAGDRHASAETVRVMEQLDRRSTTTADRAHPRPLPVAAAADGTGTSRERPAAGRRAAGAPLLLDAVELLKDGGRYFEADLLLRSADRPEPVRLREASRMLSGSLTTDGAIEWVQRFADTGDRQALSEAAEMLESRGRTDEALDWYERAAEAGDRDALLAAARMLADSRQVERALEWYGRAATAGVPSAHGESVMLRQQADAAEKGATAQPAASAAPGRQGQDPAGDPTGNSHSEAAPLVPPTAVPAPARRVRIPRQSVGPGRTQR